jgi:carboxypeptidase T
MRSTWIVMILIVVVALLCSNSGSAAGPSIAATGPIRPPHETTVVRVYYPDLATGNKVLISFEPELLETNYEQGYHLLEVAPEDLARLVAAGLRVEPDEAWVAPPVRPSQEVSIQTISGYPCYRTVEETFAAAQALVAARPDLATWIDVGDSWEKGSGLGGYDMMVLKLTNSAVTGEKPKLFVTAAIHAREYATAELVTRFGEYLVNNYGIDADATWILDYQEVHLMLQVNPDGRKQAETGLFWRKNTNQNYCGATSIDRGADLNRNFDFEWACCGGSSGLACSETYHGPSAASEPEVQAVQAYLTSIFPDQRDPGLTDASPADATGIYIDMHSYGQLVLWPWGFTSAAPANASGLQTLGRKWAYFSGYMPEQAIGLYATDGGSEDYAYGVLGVAAYVWEVGTAFFESCSYFTDTLIAANMPALIYAAKVARTPYLTPAGPDATALTLSADPVSSGEIVTLTASINDTRYSNSNGTEPTQNIAAAEYYVDVPPWVDGAAAQAMAAADGSFDSTIEHVTASFDITGWRAAKHTLFVRGQDSSGNWGAFSAIFLTTPGPTAVTLVSFTATGEGKAIALTWETASEVDTLGFDLYRAVQVDGTRTKINDELIPSQVAPGSSCGAVYSYRDRGARPNRTYYYWLEDVDIYGDTRLQGPVGARWVK